MQVTSICNFIFIYFSLLVL